MTDEKELAWTGDLDLTMTNLDFDGGTFSAPPKANWRCYYGDSKNVCYQFYIERPPNWLQRKLMGICLGIHWERVDDG